MTARIPSPNRIRHLAAPNPYSCRWCGTDSASHGRRWVESQGVHGWEQPTNAQIKARMRARRAALKEN